MFVIGGNGSGKTTLAKLLAGLYVPHAGEIRLDGRPVTADNRESYRQLFSVVFDGAVVFDNLWGLEDADLDRRAREYLRLLELDRSSSMTLKTPRPCSPIPANGRTCSPTLWGLC